MEPNCALVWAIFLVGAIALIGFFWTKAPGFGRHTTSTLVLLVIAILSALLLASSKLDGQYLSSIFTAIAGFVGGLIAGGKPETSIPNVQGSPDV